MDQLKAWNLFLYSIDFLVFFFFIKIKATTNAQIYYFHLNTYLVYFQNKKSISGEFTWIWTNCWRFATFVAHICPLNPLSILVKCPIFISKATSSLKLHLKSFIEFTSKCLPTLYISGKATLPFNKNGYISLWFINFQNSDLAVQRRSSNQNCIFTNPQFSSWVSVCLCYFFPEFLYNS